MTGLAKPTGLPWLRLDPRSGWRIEGAPDGLVLDAAGVRLGFPGRRTIADAEPFGSLGGRTLPTGIAISAVGRVFLADPSGRRILTYVQPPEGTTRTDDAAAIWPFTELWPARDLPTPGPHDLQQGGRPADPYTLIEPRDVALAANGDLVIADAGGDTGTGRILVLAMPTGAVRQSIDMAGAAPSAIGFDAVGRAYVADTKGNRILRFDALWRPDPEYRGGDGSLLAPRHLHVIASTAPHICGGGGPGCDCEAENCDCLADGSVITLSRGALFVLDPRGRPVRTEVPETLVPPPLTFDADGCLVHAVAPRDALRLNAVTVTRSGTLTGTPLALGAMAKRVILPRDGQLVTEALMGDRDGFAWHRITLEAKIPERTRLVVQTYTSDDALEPTRIAALLESDWSIPLALTETTLPEILVQSPGGKRLWLRLQFFGDGDKTPLVAGIEIHGPRHSALELLPAPFHQDPESARFLDRFLSYSDTQFAEITALNLEIALYLDPYAVPTGEFLSWLGAWFDWRFLSDWPDATRREMIATSVQFFRERGTAAGLRRLLQWHTGLPDPLPVIIEHHRLRGWQATDGRTMLHVGGLPMPGVADDLAHHFTVVLPRAAAQGAEAETKIADLIEAQKPAHTFVEMRFVETGVRIGRQSSLGIDMILGCWPSQPLGAGALGQGFHTGSGDAVIGSTIIN